MPASRSSMATFSGLLVISMPSVISISSDDGGSPVSASTRAAMSANPDRKICCGDRLTASDRCA